MKNGPRVYESKRGIQSEKKDTDLKDLYKDVDLEINDEEDSNYLTQDDSTNFEVNNKQNFQSNEELTNLLDKLLLNFEKQYEPSQYNLPDEDDE